MVRYAGGKAWSGRLVARYGLVGLWSGMVMQLTRDSVDRSELVGEGSGRRVQVLWAEGRACSERAIWRVSDIWFCVGESGMLGGVVSGSMG